MLVCIPSSDRSARYAGEAFLPASLSPRVIIGTTFFRALMPVSPSLHSSLLCNTPPQIKPGGESGYLHEVWRILCKPFPRIVRFLLLFLFPLQVQICPYVFQPNLLSECLKLGSSQCLSEPVRNHVLRRYIGYRNAAGIDFLT